MSAERFVIAGRTFERWEHGWQELIANSRQPVPGKWSRVLDAACSLVESDRKLRLARGTVHTLRQFLQCALVNGGLDRTEMAMLNGALKAFDKDFPAAEAEASDRKVPT